MKRDEFFNSLRTKCLGEFKDNEGNETVLYIDFSEETQRIDIGTVCNFGIITELSVDYDSDFSIDENLQNVLKEVYNNGYTDINE